MGGWDAPWHWIVVAIVVIALVGYKKLPDASRAVGRSLRIFKSEVKGMTGDDKAREAKGRDDDAARDGAATPVQPKALPRAQTVPTVNATRPAEVPLDRPRPRPAPTPAAGPRRDDAG